MKIEGLNVIHYTAEEIFGLIGVNNLGLLYGGMSSIFIFIFSLMVVVYIFPIIKIYIENKEIQKIKKLKRASLQKILVQKEIEAEVEKEIEADTKRILEMKNK